MARKNESPQKAAMREMVLHDLIYSFDFVVTPQVMEEKVFLSGFGDEIRGRNN